MNATPNQQLSGVERELFLERVAICTEDGRLSELEAERIAWGQILAARKERMLSAPDPARCNGMVSCSAEIEEVRKSG